MRLWKVSWRPQDCTKPGLKLRCHSYALLSTKLSPIEALWKRMINFNVSNSSYHKSCWKFLYNSPHLKIVHEILRHSQISKYSFLPWTNIWTERLAYSSQINRPTSDSIPYWTQLCSLLKLRCSQLWKQNY